MFSPQDVLHVWLARKEALYISSESGVYMVFLPLFITLIEQTAYTFLRFFYSIHFEFLCLKDEMRERGVRNWICYCRSS